MVGRRNTRGWGSRVGVREQLANLVYHELAAPSTLRWINLSSCHHLHVRPLYFSFLSSFHEITLAKRRLNETYGNIFRFSNAIQHIRGNRALYPLEISWAAPMGVLCVAETITVFWYINSRWRWKYIVLLDSLLFILWLYSDERLLTCLLRGNLNLWDKINLINLCHLSFLVNSLKMY